MLLTVKIPRSILNWVRTFFILHLLILLVVISTCPWDIIAIVVNMTCSIFFWRLVDSVLRMRLCVAGTRMNLVESNLVLSCKWVWTSTDAAIACIIRDVIEVLLVVLGTNYWHIVTVVQLVVLLSGQVVALSQRRQVYLADACTCTTFLSTHHDHRVDVVSVIYRVGSRISVFCV